MKKGIWELSSEDLTAKTEELGGLQATRFRTSRTQAFVIPAGRSGIVQPVQLL
jgi:hypothetical protein